MNGLDQAVFRAVNGMPDALAPFFVFLSEATKRREGIVLLVIVFALVLYNQKTRTAGILSMVAWPLANGLTDIFKYGMQWSRPSWESVRNLHPDYHMRVAPLDSFGTASAHSANMMAIAAVFLWLYRPFGWVWLVVALLTGMSRVYVGVHWPSEVVLGWLCGLAVGTLVVKAWQWYVSSRKTSDPASHPAEP